MDNRQVAEVQAPAKPAQHPLYAWPEKPRLIGTRISRVDGPMKVCVSFPNETSRVGDPVQVDVTFKYDFLPYVGGSLTSATVTNTSVMRLEQDPPFPPHCTA